MKVRVKFSKSGCMKFIGHLDVMRYFQKALRRADIPVSFSEGYSPHMLMSFASPLGVGKTGSGEYFDISLQIPMDPDRICRLLNEQMAEGICVLKVCEIPEIKAANCMSLVEAADYTVSLRPEKITLPADTEAFVQDFLSQGKIMVLRKTKRKEEMTDIRPWIFSFRYEGGQFFMRLSSGSVHNLKPELVMEAFADLAGFKIPPYALLINRDELYFCSHTDDKCLFIPLEKLDTSFYEAEKEQMRS